MVMRAMKEGTAEEVAVKQIPIKVDDDRHQEKIMVRCRRLACASAVGLSDSCRCILCSGRSAC